MEHIWTILKLEPTTDERVIKKAYAREVKNCHQEDEPERWMELHKAYQQAMEYAKHGKDTSTVLMNASASERHKRDAPCIQKSSLTEAVVKKEEEQPQDNYVEAFDEIAVSVRRKQQYLQVFPEIPEGNTFRGDLDFMKFFFEGGASTAFWKDLCFWQAFAEYMEQGKWTSWAYAYLVDKLETFQKNEALMLNERVKAELQRQQYLYWQKCKEQTLLLPKHRAKNMLRSVKWADRLMFLLAFAVLMLFAVPAGLIGRILKYGSL